jgi:hypothetical protein
MTAAAVVRGEFGGVRVRDGYHGAGRKTCVGARKRSTPGKRQQQIPFGNDKQEREPGSGASGRVDEVRRFEWISPAGERKSMRWMSRLWR